MAEQKAELRCPQDVSVAPLVLVCYRSCSLIRLTSHVSVGSCLLAGQADTCVGAEQDIAQTLKAVVAVECA